jgi:superfamily II DNA/RNA helicase
MNFSELGLTGAQLSACESLGYSNPTAKHDVPDAPENYVHRVGRTGRAGNRGKAITIVTPVDELSMRAIERLTGQRVKRVVPEGFGGLDAATTSTAKSFVPFARTTNMVRSFRPRRGR